MKKILLIEDDPFLIDIYTTRLKEEGFKIDVARDGKTALDKIKKTIPDLLILDIILPKVDGWDLLEKVRKDPKLKEIKVIILSNLSEEEDVEKGFKLGVIMYFIKAKFTPSEVVKEINKILK